MLDELQDFLVQTLQREQPVVDDDALASACARHVAGNDRLSPAEQVDIYRRQFWLRHVDALLEDYPGLRHVLGEDGFEAFCHGYLAAHPPHTPSLRDLGADIPAFAARYEGFPPGRRGLAVAMARYENAFIDIFDAADPPPLDPALLQGMPSDAWQTARVVLRPDLALMEVRHPVHRLRFDLRAGLEPDLERASAVADEPTFLALFRKDFVVHYDELAPEAFALLVALRAGTPLVPACEALVQGKDAAAAAAIEAQVGPWFQRWTAASWIVDVVR